MILSYTNTCGFSKEPYVELFIWAVRCNKGLLVEFFWNRTNNPVLMAVIAGCVYSKLAQFYKGTVSFCHVIFLLQGKRDCIFNITCSQINRPPLHFQNPIMRHEF